MAYFINLFSPETYQAFSQSPRDVSGFRLRHTQESTLNPLVFQQRLHSTRRSRRPEPFDSDQFMAW
jgi:hypothetical protein